MNLTETEVRAAYHAVADLLRIRRRTGEQIPGWLRQLAARLETEIRSGFPEPDRARPAEISTDDAAAILGCSTRWIRKIATDLDGRQISRTWVFDRHAVEEYAKARHAA